MTQHHEEPQPSAALSLALQQRATVAKLAGSNASIQYCPIRSAERLLNYVDAGLVIFAVENRPEGPSYVLIRDAGYMPECWNMATMRMSLASDVQSQLNYLSEGLVGYRVARTDGEPYLAFARPPIGVHNAELKRLDEGCPTDGAACDVFLKVGGSVIDDPASSVAMVPALIDAAKERRISILTGGGLTAKRIKSAQITYGLEFSSCWQGGIRSLDLNALILSAYSSSLQLAKSIGEARMILARGLIPVFSPSSIIFSKFPFPASWSITTDSMGLYFASLLGAKRYLVVTDVEGVYADHTEVRSGMAPIGSMTPNDLERLPSSKLDGYFPDYFRRYKLPSFVVSGRYPDRVRQAIVGEETIGTEIVAASSSDVVYTKAQRPEPVRSEPTT